MNSSETDTRILFVDDEEDVRSAFERSMQAVGFQIDSAGSGDEALDLAMGYDYPVVVTDLRMPGLDGVTLMKKLHDRSPSTVFVVVTGLPELLDLYGNPTLDRAIFSLIPKPWDNTEMASILRRAFDLHETRAASLIEISGESEPLPFLLVDGDSRDVRVFELLLSETEFKNRELATAAKLNDAIDLLHGNQYGLVLTDLALPDARGLDAVHRIRTAAPETALVVLTGLSDDSLALQALEMGAQDYVVKQRLNVPALNRAIRYSIGRKRTERKRARLAYYDPLTGLATPTTLKEQIRRALSVAKRHGRRFALMVLDLDKFKELNDNLGHSAGNAILRRVAARVEHTVRSTDTPARLGADRFAVLLEDIDDPLVVGLVAERLLSSVSEPISISGSEVAVGCTIGVACYPECGESIDDLLASADASLLAGKKRHKGNSGRPTKKK